MTDTEIAYLKNNSIDEAIRQKPRKTDVYEIDMHKIYNIILVQTNKQLHEKVESDVTFQALNTGRYPIRYLIILNNLCFYN